MPGASQAGAWRTKHSLLTTNYEPKSPLRRADDRSDAKIVIVRGAPKAPIVRQAAAIANQELADIGLRLGTSDFSSFSPVGMSLPSIRITVERQLAPRLPQQTGGRDPGALSLQDAAQAASVTIALNHDGAVSIVPSNCSISVKGVIPLNQFCERQIETVIADFVDQLTSAAAT